MQCISTESGLAGDSGQNRLQKLSRTFSAQDFGQKNPDYSDSQTLREKLIKNGGKPPFLNRLRVRVGSPGEIHPDSGVLALLHGRAPELPANLG
jgi:hypothetical protein